MATNARPSECGVGTACPGCGRRLPLRLTEFGEEAALWECVGCDAPFAGTLLPDMVAMLAQRIRLSQRHFDVDHAKPMPFTLRQVIQRIHNAEPLEEMRDLRRSMRVSGVRQALTACLDGSQGASGNALCSTIANLSSNGLLLVTGEPLEGNTIVAQVERPRAILQLLANVVWRQHLGGGCYGAGAELVARFGRVQG